MMRIGEKRVRVVGAVLSIGDVGIEYYRDFD
jgi:hypothetical protein